MTKAKREQRAQVVKLARSPRGLVKQLVAVKGRFGVEDRAAKHAILAELQRTKIREPQALLHYHEALLFIRAYPDDAALYKLACGECKKFGERVLSLRRSDPGAAGKLEDTGIAQTGMYYSYDYAAVIWLLRWFGDALEIDWDSFEATEKIDRLLPLLCEWAENDSLDLSDITSEAWLTLRRGAGGRSSLRWFVDNLARAIPSYSVRMNLYDALDLPIIWQLGDSPAARTHAGSPSASPGYHTDGLMKQVGVFSEEIAKPLPPLEYAPPRKAAYMIRAIRATLGVRHRALYPIDYASRDEVLIVDAGRGYEIILYGMEPGRRLPVESDYGVLIIKNGFIFGYGVGALLFEQVEIAVNIFDTWRGGESRYVFTQFVRAFRNHFGCTRFKIERYQVGYENDEGLQSGAFWFYYRLGFVPKAPKVRALARREQAKIDKNRAYRSPPAVLEKLALSDLYLVLEGEATKISDDFPVADLSLAVTRMIGERFDGDRRNAINACTESVARLLRCPDWVQWSGPERDWFTRLSLIVAQIEGLERWSPAEKRELVAIMRAKGGPQETDYARRMVRATKLRAALERVARGG